MRHYRLLVVAVVMVLSMLGITRSADAKYDERILSFHSDITVHADSSMTVAETIRVVVQGLNIKHGIYRDFPTRYRDRNHRTCNVGFHVKNVTLNGVPEKFLIEKNGRNQRVYIGNADINLSPGEYEYCMTYSTNRQLGFLEDHDELHWNVTGYEWNFQIEEASASVLLPGSVAESDFNLMGYTGPEGSTATNYTAEVVNSNTVLFETTQPLDVRENLAILISFPKGVVQPPSLADRQRFWMAEHHAEIAGAVGLLVLAAFYVPAWLLAGRDPRRGQSYMQDTPPAGLSPAALRYVMRMGADSTTFTAAIIRMAACGYLVLEVNGDGEYTLKRGQTGDEMLTCEELQLARSLFSGKDSIQIIQDNHALLSTAQDTLAASLQAQYQAGYFSRNMGLFAFGAVWSVIVCVAMIALHGSPDLAFMLIFTAVCNGVAVIPIATYLSDHNQLFSTPWTTTEGQGGTALLSTVAFAGIMLALSLIPLGFMVYLVSLQMSVVAFLLIVLNCLFYMLLPAYSRSGRRLMDQIGGFRLWLASQESGRYLAEELGELTRFEQFLPYAVALGVQQEWTSQFELALAEAGRSDTRLAYPHWYSDAQSDRYSFNEFTDSVSSSFTSSFSSAATTPSNSGGSGGYSGGGGGGGGGGGW